MMITREADYGIRTIRALSSGDKRNITAICEEENVPRQFAYKILKKLSHAGIVSIVRGVNGGYVLNTDIEKLTLFDIVSAIDESVFINKCVDSNHKCERNQDTNSCKVHQEMLRIQNVMETELKRTPICELI